MFAQPEGLVRLIMTDDATELTPVPLADVLPGVLEREEITVLFQPIFDLETKAPYGYEAFARGPEQTDLEDYESLYNVANAADLFLPLDRACRRRAIIAAGRLPADYHVFVKMLPMSVGNDRFGAKDLFTLYEDELMPSQVVWQISERDLAHRELFALHGFSVGLDRTREQDNHRQLRSWIQRFGPDRPYQTSMHQTRWRTDT